jgi:hypothetical protein
MRPAARIESAPSEADNDKGPHGPASSVLANDASHRAKSEGLRSAGYRIVLETLPLGHREVRRVVRVG